MTGKERALRTFSGLPTDRVPYCEQSVCCKVASEILGRPAFTGGGLLRMKEGEIWLRSDEDHDAFVHQVLDDLIACARFLGWDMITVPWRHSLRPTKKLDDRTFLYGDENDWFAVYRYHPETDVFDCVDDTLKRQGLKAIPRVVDATEQSLKEGGRPVGGAYSDFEFLVEKVGSELAVASPAGFIAIPLRTEWLETLIEEPSLVHRYLNAVCEMNLIAMEETAKKGAACFWGGGDLANESGVLYGVHRFRTFLLPHLQRLAAASRRLQVPYFFRTDGNIWSIASILFEEVGFQGYGEIDVDAGMDLIALRQRFPNLILWGGISCGKDLVFNTPQQIADTVHFLLERLAPHGRLFFGSSNAIHIGVPTENFLAMTQSVRQFRCRLIGSY
ncbi:MAG: hypothetical protein NZ959_09905 [Armatimonadetes bacterium]|nr:hypothetical protein [Armatimonadota bacterium]MDW8122757.1 uroporphyrinogen decarboxylase family protein [Armatimonadota bacterium]